MVAKKIKYEEIEVTKHFKGSKVGPMTVEKAKEILGYEAEEEGKKEFGQDFLFRDVFGKKVRLNFRLTNRPFRIGLSKRWMNEILRKKFALNGETVVIDKFGGVQDGQHRLAGLILAEQERLKNKEHWKAFGNTGPCQIEMIVVTGIDPDHADTLNLGQKRSLGDVIFRNHDFENMSEREQQKLANVLAGATRLAWIRTGGKLISAAPHFPHSEALDFMEAHPRLRDAVEFVFNEEGGSGAEGKKISSFVSLGYASAMLYLMGTAKTDKEKWKVEGTAAINDTLWEKAEKFWTLFASGAGLEKNDPILSLRKVLLSADASAGAARDEIVAAIITAWNLWVDGKSGEVKEIKPKKVKNDDGKLVLAFMPRIGGLDTEEEAPEEVEEEEVDEEAHEEEEGDGEAKPAKPTKKAAKKAAGKPTKPAKPTKAAKKPAKKKGGYEVGEWVWVRDDEDKQHWKGQITTIDGNDVVLKAELDEKEYAAEIGQLSVDKPED